MKNTTKATKEKKPVVIETFTKKFDKVVDVLDEFMNLEVIDELFNMDRSENDDIFAKDFLLEAINIFEEQVETNNLRFYQLTISSNRFLLKTDEYIEISYQKTKDGTVVGNVRLFNPLKVVNERNYLVENGWELKTK